MIRVRLFASLREAAGMSELSFPLDSDVTEVTARDVFEQLTRRAPALAELERVTLVAVNESYATWETAVRPDDEVAFFPPVSGGTLGSLD